MWLLRVFYVYKIQVITVEVLTIVPKTPTEKPEDLLNGLQAFLRNESLFNFPCVEIHHFHL